MKKIIFFLAINACLIGATYSQIKDSVTIAGKIEGYSRFSEHQFVKAFVNDVVIDDQIMFMSAIGQGGDFNLKISLDGPQTFYFYHANQLITLFANPGDSLFLAFPAFAFISESSDTAAENYVHCSGNEVEMNRLLLEYASFTANSQTEFYKSLQQKKAASKEEFKAILQEHRKDQRKLFQHFISGKKKVPERFNQWASIEIDYEFGNDLLLYWFDHFRDTFPDEWFDFMKELPLARPEAFMSAGFTDYLHHLGMFREHEFSKSGVIAAMRKNKENYIGALMDSIVQNSSGYAKDIFLTHSFSSASESIITKEWYASFLPRYFDEVKDERCRAYIQKCYGLSDEAKIPVNLLEELERWSVPDSVKDVLPLLLENHKGEVVVLDFWATWCGPCRGELKRFYPEFVSKFKKEKVAFIFLASSSPKDTWQRMVSELKFKGEHHLLTNSQYALLQNLFQITGIPHHVLIDKNGKVVANSFSLSEDMIRKLLE